jgi:excisionase family DNA binding protein
MSMSGPAPTWPRYAGEPDDLTTRQAAGRLHVTPATVRRRIRARRLYAYRLGSGLRLPVWQFINGGVLPHLPEVLAAFPADTHPMTLHGFMTTPSDELDNLAAVDWLAQGRSIEAVLFAATAVTMG